MDKLFLSVIIPCYNEAENLKHGVLAGINNYLKEKKFSWEVIISDDGSSDESRELVKKEIGKWVNFRLLKNPHGGKPSALWFGIKASRGKYILFSDMDQSTPIAELDKLLPYVGERVGAVIGSRGRSRKNFPFYRRLGSIVFTELRKSFILPEINDTQCGFKLIKKSTALEIFPLLEFFKKKVVAKGWKVTSWDVEFLFILKKRGLEIKEVPVYWEDVDLSKGKGGSLNRYIRESNEMLSQIIKVKVNDSKGMYNFRK